MQLIKFHGLFKRKLLVTLILLKKKVDPNIGLATHRRVIGFNDLHHVQLKKFTR
jgi:hypothetical protein